MIGLETNIQSAISGLMNTSKKTDEFEKDVAQKLALEVLHNIQLPPPQGAPVDTGTLSRNHFVRLAGKAAELYCPIYYWIYVVYGKKESASHSTSRPTYMGQTAPAGAKGGMKGGNDYPTRAMQQMISSGAYEKIVKESAETHIKFK